MKIAVLLVVASWATVSRASAATTASQPLTRKPEAATKDSELSRAAAAQLQRLAPFRRTSLDDQSQTITVAPTSITTNKKTATRQQPDPRQTRSKVSKPSDQELRIPINFTELFRILSDPQEDVMRDKRNEPVQLTPDRMAKLDKYADKLMQDERVQSYMLERIKRDHYGGGYGGYGGGAGGGSSDSGSFVSGLAGQLVGSVVGLSTTASRGSSGGHQPAPVYGPPAYHSYGKESFSIWDFKKAIMNTLIQAVKAIGGGVLALKGQLIKGGGFLVSTKGRIISSAGEAISGLGKTLAASAVVQPPPPKPYGHVGYAYEAPIITHDAHYDGPPPSADAYHSFGAASDDEDVQAGLLISKPTPSLEVHTDHYETEHIQTDHHHHVEQHHTDHHHSEEIEDLDPPKPEQNVKDVVGHLTGSLNLYQNNQPHDDPPAIPGNTLQLQDYNQASYDLYPPLGHGPPDDDKTHHHHQQQQQQQPPKYESPPVQDYGNTPDYPQKYEYPIHHTNTYSLPTKYGVPSIEFPQHNYLPPKPHYHVHREPDIQIEISDHDITGFETSGYGKYKRHPPGLHVVAMQGPLKIPILGPSGYYKSPAFPPGHINSINGIGKYPRYGPGFEIQQSIGYELRRNGKKVHRI